LFVVVVVETFLKTLVINYIFFVTTGGIHILELSKGLIMYLTNHLHIYTPHHSAIIMELTLWLWYMFGQV